MKNYEIISTMVCAGTVNASLVFVLDRDYACPALDYIEQEFAKWFWEEQHRRGLATWTEEANDCDNFSVRAFADMGMAHALASPSSKVGLAFGLFFYKPDWSLQKHAINCAIIKGPDGEYRVVFFEPNPKAGGFGVLNLSQEERNSCVGYLFC